MNYFAHAFRFLDDPYLAAGTGVPDWLAVVDRHVRIRIKHAEPMATESHSPAASVAQGIVQHIRDDRRFHATRAFAEISLELTTKVRQALGGESGFRPNFLGHLLVEVLLDAALVADNPSRLEAYYRTLDAVDGDLVETAVNRMAPRPTGRLARMISRFRRERILWDYLEDAKLFGRLNQVMRRVKFARLPERFLDLLPEVRSLVARRKADLLDGIPAGSRV